MPRTNYAEPLRPGWSGSVNGLDGRTVYGIPGDDSRVIKFDLVKKSIGAVGPNRQSSNRRWKWDGGVISTNGIIYCVSTDSSLGIMKIDTFNNDSITFINIDRLNIPEDLRREGENRHWSKWAPGALALDGCIYFMPTLAGRILKIDPKNDKVTLVGDELGEEFTDEYGTKWRKVMYSGTVAGNDGFLYGIPDEANCIVQYDPVTGNTSFFGEVPEDGFKCIGNGAKGRNGHIYAINLNGQILKIDTIIKSCWFVGDALSFDGKYGWGDAVSGNDGCIYFPPVHANQVLKFDTETERQLLVGHDFGNEYDKSGHKARKWLGGALASDGNIYCIPYQATHILAIDPYRHLKEGIYHHHLNLGLLNQTHATLEDNVVAEEKSTSQSAFLASESSSGPNGEDSTYAREGAINIFEDSIPSEEYCKGVKNLHRFIVAASLPSCPLYAVYHFLRRDPSLVKRQDGRRSPSRLTVSSETFSCNQNSSAVMYAKYSLPPITPNLIIQNSTGTPYGRCSVVKCSMEEVDTDDDLSCDHRRSFYHDSSFDEFQAQFADGVESRCCVVM